MDPDLPRATRVPTAGFAGPETDPHVAPGLARPDVDAAGAAGLALRLYGLRATATELGSNQDRNFLLEVHGAGADRRVLKIDNAAFGPDELAAQNRAIDRLAEVGVGVARVLPGLDGSPLQVAEVSGSRHHVRLFEHVAGRSLVDAGYLPDATLRALGSVAASVDSALEGFEHPGLDRALQWDLRRGADVARSLLAAVGDPDRALRVAAAVDAAEQALAPLASRLPVQPIHGDLTDDNVIAAHGPVTDARGLTVIDFGDLALGWRAAELAVTCSSLLHHRPGDPLAVLPAVAAFHARSPLSVPEALALWPLMVLRAAVLVGAGWAQTALEPGNAYASERMDHEWLIFETATCLPTEVATAAVLAELGLPAHAAPTAADDAAPGALGMLQDAYVLDLGVESPHLAEGSWLEDGIEERLVAAALTRHATVVLPHGDPRLTRTAVNSRTAGATVPLALQMYTNVPVGLRAPWAGTARTVGAHSLELRAGDGTRLLLDGVVPAHRDAGRVGPGDALAVVPASYPGRSGAASIRIATADAPEAVPLFAAPGHAPAWRILTPDPGPLLGLPARAAPASASAEQRRRERLLSSAQERYFADPPHIERGWRHHLIDADGRAYVDMVNNVAGIGHSHPAVARAAAEQLRLLNTNSRFLYRSLAEYGERLVALAPAGSGLDTVLLVNSGSEAVDLAIRLARAATGRRTMVALREAYHGWTVGADAVTTSAYDNPRALASRPEWVHVADVPNPLRGRHTGPGAGAAYAAELAGELDGLARDGRPAAAFICESVLGNAGGVLLPDGYLRDVYAAVRAHGGLCIADEIQVGFGRMGSGFWGFGLQGVVPDIVTIAKPMGNGFPIGGVLTTRAIAEALGEEGMFFSSAGGSPLACRVGLAVLDAMRDESLAENARDVGGHLRRRLEELGERHPMVAHVHGAGLYLGVELVTDRATLEPAARETASICERLRELGVIVQPTSERQNVLKIKPPLCLTRESADFAVDAIDHVLSTGW
ncbi:MAG: aminotransferase [Arthrobacter sp.]|uniref:aminotransferase n=1 Tax=Arthrobacter sp. TaxID=1667 RepID=UPI00347E9834